MLNFGQGSLPNCDLNHKQCDDCNKLYAVFQLIFSLL